MKIKISKKIISICLTLLICISVLPLSTLTASAAEYDITIRNVVYPRPGATPQVDIKKESVSRYNLYGWVWMGDDDTVAMGPDEKFTDFYSSIMGSSGDFFYELDTFTDTVSYSLSLMFVLKDKIVIPGIECDVVFYDENNAVQGVTQGSFLPVKYARKDAEAAGIALPEDLTDNDTIMLCSTSSKMCCPEDHIHIQGQYSYDDNGHWRECTVCGKKIFDSDGEHRKYCTRTESWTCINQATASKEGEYEKQCSTCSYVMDRITVPKTGEQTVVTTYDELRNALAKGGKQWIKLDFPSKFLKQEDFNYNYTLCVDDPDADITIDLNNCGLRRTTMYDKYLFEVKQGSLRLWQENGNNILDNGYNTHNNLSLEGNKCKAVFNVEAAGSLKLTNVHALSPGSDDIGTFTYAFPIVKSSGNLRIDSGLYCSYVDTPAVDVCSGYVFINGGEFYSHASGTALKISGTDSNKTYKVIKYCNDIYFDDFDQIWNHKTVGDFKNPKNDTNAPYTIGNVRWEMFSKILIDDFEFESGDNVAVRIDVIPKEGYTFYSTVFGKLNGIDSYATIKNADGSRSIVFNMTITAPDEYKTQNIELSVAEPVAGKAPATTAKCTSGYAVPGTPSWTPADTTFKSGKRYTVKIPVTAEYEWGDIDTVTAKVNGKDAKFIAEYKGGKQYAYFVEYTFDAAKDFMLGDVNNDGKINMLDAILVQKHGVGLSKLSDTQLEASDVNKDGKVNMLDAILLQKYSLGILTGF